MGDFCPYLLFKDGGKTCLAGHYLIQWQNTRSISYQYEYDNLTENDWIAREKAFEQLKICMNSDSFTSYADESWLKCSYYKNCNKTPEELNRAGGCYISTACVVAQGLPDDCYQLELLRKHRDLLVQQDENIKALVEEYYLNAPKIVSLINARSDSVEIYQKLYVDLVCKCVTFLEQGDIPSAIANYKKIYQSLKELYGNDEV